LSDAQLKEWHARVRHASAARCAFQPGMGSDSTRAVRPVTGANTALIRRRRALQELSQTSNLDEPRKAAEEAERVFHDLNADVLSILETELGALPDSYLNTLKGDPEKLKPVSHREIALAWAPKGGSLPRNFTVSTRATFCSFR
jgi:hypothetical protein